MSQHLWGWLGKSLKFPNLVEVKSFKIKLKIGKLISEIMADLDCPFTFYNPLFFAPATSFARLT